MGCVTINVQGIYTWIPQSETGDDNVLKKKRIQGIGEQIYAVRRNVKR